MTTQSLRAPSVTVKSNLWSILLSLILGLLGTSLLLSVLSTLTIASASEESRTLTTQGEAIATLTTAPATTTVRITKTVVPSHPHTGDIVDICFTITVSGLSPRKLDVALVQDVSGSMTGTALIDSKNAAIAFVEHLQMPPDQVAVIAYSTTVTVIQSLTTNGIRITEAITDLEAYNNGWTNIGSGISVGHEKLITDTSDTVKAIVLLSDGLANCDENDYCNDDPGTLARARAYAITQTRYAYADGIKIYTIGFGDDVDEDLLREIAGISDGEYYPAPDGDTLEMVYLTIALELHNFTVTDILTPGIETSSGIPTVTIPINPKSLIPGPAFECFTATVNLDPDYEGPINTSGSSFCYQDSDGETICIPINNPPVTVDGRKITGDVFYDVNANGYRDVEEAGVPSVTVQTSAGLSTQTSVSGSYVLRASNEPAISVTIEMPTDCIPTSPISWHIPPTTGTHSDKDFGIYCSGVCVQGKVFNDFNVNEQDDEEAGLSGVTIAVNSGVSTTSVATGDDGMFFACAQLPSGAITITETDLEGCSSTTAIPGDGVQKVDSNTLRINNPITGSLYSGNAFGDLCIWRVYLPIVVRNYAAPSLESSTKEVDKSVAYPGETLRYTIKLTNSGTTEAISATVTDTIPTNTMYITGSVAGGEAEDNQIRWQGSVGPKETHIIEFETRINDFACSVVINNEVIIADGTGEPLSRLKATEVLCVVNGGFENGWTGWTHGGDLSTSISPNNPRSGSFSALLGNPAYNCRGGVPKNKSAWIEQAIPVPLTGSPRLSFWYNIFTHDKNSDLGSEYDIFTVKVNDLEVFWDMNTTNPYKCDNLRNLGWRQGTIDLVNNELITDTRGTSITVRFENWNRYDGWYNTWTYIDDVQILP